MTPRARPILWFYFFFFTFRRRRCRRFLSLFIFYTSVLLLDISFFHCFTSLSSFVCHFLSLSLSLISGCWFAHKYAYVYSQVLRAHFCSLFLFRSFVRFSSSPHLFRKLTTVNTSPEKPSLSIDIYCYDFDSILILRMCFDFDFDSTPKKCLK